MSRQCFELDSYNLLVGRLENHGTHLPLAEYGIMRMMKLPATKTQETDPGIQQEISKSIAQSLPPTLLRIHNELDNL